MTGRTLVRDRYRLYPKSYFAGIAGSDEIVIVVHGLRNDNAGAIQKARIAKNRLRRLGYRHPVVGFSYDSNTTGAHLVRHAKRALTVGVRIARKNGRNLALFLQDFAESSPDTRVRLVGHSLGSQVILGALEYLARRPGTDGMVEAAYLFGASITHGVPSSPKYRRALQVVVRKKVVNYFAPTDEVLLEADGGGMVDGPLGLRGASGRPFPKYAQKKVRPANHRFASYAATLRSFP